MGSMVVLVGSMPSLASLVSLGSLSGSTATSSCVESSSYSVVKRVSLSKRSLRRAKSWHCVCKYSVTATDFIAEQGNAVSLDSSSSTISGGSNGDGNDGDSEVVLKPSPKPVLKSPAGSKDETLLSMNSVGWDSSRGSGDSDEEEERNKVIESLDEVLEKAGKLETSKQSQVGVSAGSIRKENGNVNKMTPSNSYTDSRNVNSTAATRKAKTLRSVWRKGDTVSSVQRIVKEVPKASSKFTKEEPKTVEGTKLESQSRVPLKPPQPPLRPQPKLQAKPSAAPSPIIKKPVVLKDVGAAPKSPIKDETGSVAAPSKGQPILIDKFARKKPVVDPLIARAVLAPTKPGKGPASGKYKDRKKGASPGTPRRRMVDNDVEIPDEELNVSIPGAATARKGRKWTKASRKAAKIQAAREAAPVKVEILEVGEKGMSLEELAYNLTMGEGEILGLLFSKGIKPDGVQTLDKEMVKMICKEYEVEVIDADPVRFEEMAKKNEILDEDDLDKLQERPPVLTIMGHVDHGKASSKIFRTTLLDHIRKSKVAASEAGGITQGIGAYKVMVPVDGKLQPCVFLDTPGHEAFGAMRARGARVTDIAIIVVAADDGIRPQTNEAIAHAKAAGVPIVIAINKIDKDGANPERVMQELSSIGLMPEDWGGDVPMVQISALKGENIDDLLETVMLVAELQELKANPDRNAKGTVIEAGLDKSKGPIATLIVQKGTLKRGDVVVCGEAFGKVRALFEGGGKRVDQVGPSIPVQVIGLSNVPIAGDEFEVVASLDIAREKAETRAELLWNERISAKAGDGKVTLSSLASAVSAGKLSGLDLHQLNIIMKVDLQGSMEAVRQALQVLPRDNVTLKFLLQATGDISNSDVDLAVASEAIILGFNVKAPGPVKSYAEKKGVEIRLYRVIYELIDEVRNAMEGLLELVEEQEPIGSTVVRAVFSSGSGRVAGCMVTEGKVVKGCGIRVVRNRKTVHVGVLDSLRRVKEIVKEVNAGLECGIGAEDYDDWEEGDIIEAFNTVEKKRTLEEASASMAAAMEEIVILRMNNSNLINGKTHFSLLMSVIGFSLTSPDLVICAASPDISRTGYGDSPDFMDKNKCSIEVSLENGIDGSGIKDSNKTPGVKFSPVVQTFNKELSPESSFELLPQTEKEEKLVKVFVPGVSINAGCTGGAVFLGGVEFVEDDCFAGGDTVRTDATIGDGQEGGLSLYQTARYGNFSYCFRGLEPGTYDVSLHLAEIVFTEGPPGLRVFDVFIHEKKVVSCLDIYAQVGANKPLIVSDLKAFVEGDEGLLIRFEGVMGKPIVCGITVTKDPSANTGEAQLLKPTGMSQVAECESPKEDNGHLEVEGDYEKLMRDYECQRRELTEMRRTMDELKRENRLKSRECQDALKSLQELQNDLMRKSMHVGSLAFAIEGQVKDKSRWFTSLRDLTRKLKLMKMEHIKLSEEALAYKNCVADMEEMRFTIVSTMKQQVELHEDIKIKFVEGAKERKELYNKVLELKGNIRVFCRCRPLKPEEVAAGALVTIDFESAKDGELTVMSNGLPRKTFKFDAVFGPQANQDTASFASSILDGYNVCVFAYGQTGTGKTFTMEGTEEDRGVNFRTLEQVFCMIKEREKLFRYDVSVSVLEVYNEQIRDLLVSVSQPGVAAKRLEIRQTGEGLHHVPGLVEARVHNMSEVWEVLQTGSNARAIGSTNANEHSSRSHCIHCVMGENLLNGECTKNKLWLVDLAGSERISKTEVQGERLRETQNINKSLSALGDVISALATKSPHIPFRNSKLTHLLQDSLGGDSKTFMFVQISPSENDLGETLCSLNFASRVRGIELGPAKRQLDNAELLRFKQMAEKSKQDLKSKDVQIKKMEDTINGLDLKTKEKDLKYMMLQDKVKELEAQLLVERKLARQHVDTKIAEQQQQQQMKQQQEEHIIAPPRPPLPNRILGSNKNYNEPANGALNKQQINPTQPLAGSTSNKSTIPLPSTDGIVKLIDSTEKENNPDMANQPRLPKRTGRASICTTAGQVLAAPAPRRNSMIPLPSIPSLVQLPSIPSSFLLCQVDMKQDSEGTETNCLHKQTHCDSPKGIRNGSKRLNTMLKRSLQKKANMKSPMQQHTRRGGINVGMEKVRVSIGSRGRMAHRVLLGNGRRAGMRETHQKQMLGEKERRWNSGTVARTPI
ncbi:LOW QUALITY PROTEIN: hypothetical protein NC652_004377 [Populus alba x Populus x berolinensis]|nr:LOW QUALITY PROTEIN: hypothetical protein NC652_004377 [Populus alba x Populus x berolinensis]